MEIIPEITLESLKHDEISPNDAKDTIFNESQSLTIEECNNLYQTSIVQNADGTQDEFTVGAESPSIKHMEKHCIIRNCLNHVDLSKPGAKFAGKHNYYALLHVEW